MILEYTSRQLLERLEAEPLTNKPDKKQKILDLIDEKAFLPSEENKFDIIVGNISLQLTSDLKSILGRIYGLLEEDGVFLAAVIGEDSLFELRKILSEIKHAGMPMTGMREAGNILYQTGFKVPVTELEKVTVLYEDMFALLRDLRTFGRCDVLYAENREHIGKQALCNATRMYKERFSVSEDSKDYVKASFDVIYLHGIK